jgi:hypothetical protein
MPMAKPLRQGGPFAAALGDVEDRVDDRESLSYETLSRWRGKKQFDSSGSLALISMSPAYQPSATTLCSRGSLPII